MILIATGIFTLAALGGAFLAIQALRQNQLPMIVSVVHGIIGALGIVVLIFAILSGEGGARAIGALCTFVGAAIAGFYLFSFHFREQVPPKEMVGIHAVVAITAYGLLLTSVFLES